MVSSVSLVLVRVFSVFIVDRDFVLDFSVFSLFLVVSTSATDCLGRLISEMTSIVWSGTLNFTTTSLLHDDNDRDMQITD